MNIASTVARYLLGLIFLVFGLNGFLHFIPMGPMPPGPAGEFMGALFASHYTVAIFACQLAGALLLLANRYVALGLAILAPVIANIILFHALMAPQGFPLALIVLILWILTAIKHRLAFAGLLAA